jgi:hypothetical protein
VLPPNAASTTVPAASAGSEAVAPQYATSAANPPLIARFATFVPIGAHGAVAPPIALSEVVTGTDFVVTSDYGERASLADWRPRVVTVLRH